MQNPTGTNGPGYPIRERTLAEQFLIYRGCWLAVGLLAITREGHRFRRPWLARLGWALSASEFAWILTRMRLRHRFLHGGESSTDSAVNALAMALCLLSADPSEQLGELTNWTFSVGLTAAATGTLASSKAWRTLTETLAAATVYAFTGATRRGADRMAVLLNALQYVAWWAGGQTFATQLRRASVQIADADTEAALNISAIAAIRERERMHDELYVGARRALQDVRDGWRKDRRGARVRATAEAVRLRHALRDSPDTSVEFVKKLERLAVQASHRGTRVEVLCDAALSVPPEMGENLLNATRRVLTQLPAGAFSPAIVRATGGAERPLVTIRYRGPGLSEVCMRSLRQAGGSHCQVTVKSGAQYGARISVELRNDEPLG
jgi:hypothetical protein